MAPGSREDLITRIFALANELRAIGKPHTHAQFLQARRLERRIQAVARLIEQDDLDEEEP